ncbi:PepSY domain-containing protein [Tunturiibacter lichenicola]|uniref:PepSY domain-containing protein n=1 Tax=Tunturiibacter lichenicola TaxID=2051959 RepID=UPI0021B35116|nr:PepSY domain-containing protein [Edaphobacter lichenicola]
MSSSHTFLKYTRLVHLYLGVFITPALLFFAFTGALQTFSLHETTRSSSYKPPVWAVVLGQIHKKQTTVVPVRKVPPPDKPEKSGDKPSDKLNDNPVERLADKPTTDKSQSASPSVATQFAPNASPKPSDAPTPKPHNALPLKIFFLIVAIGLFVSTLTGLYMSYKYIRNRILITAIFIAGVVIPVLLTIL